MYVYEKAEEKEKRDGPKGMEKPIPSYQRKWLLATRKERRAFSPQKTIIINIYDRAPNWSARAPFFTIGP